MDRNAASLRILFWNTRSVLKRKQELTTILQNVDIFVCVESWLTTSRTSDEGIRFPGFVVYRKDRNHAKGGGILILIRKNLAYLEPANIKTPNQTVEMCGIRINNIKPTLDFIVCYRVPGFILTQSQWNVIIENIDKNNNTILLGDFNAHHKMWNCRDTDKNGERFLNAMENLNLFLHNENSDTHVDLHRNTKSNLDLILSTMNIADKIHLKVYDETLGSDHYPIYITVDVDKNYYTKKSFKLKSMRTDWNQFASNLQNYYPRFLSTDYDKLSAVQKYETLVETITKSVKSSTPKKQNTNRSKDRNPVPWWDSECDKIKRLRRASFKKWEYTKSLENLITYKKMCALAIKTFKTKKKEAFKEFAKSIDYRTDAKFVWNKCKIFKNSWIKTHPSHFTDNLQTEIKKENALNKISPPWAYTDPNWIPPCNKNEFFDTPFDFTEFNIALNSKNTKSAPGVDGIDYEILNKIPIKFQLLLLDIFNEMYKTTNYPLNWKTSFVHFIDKPDGQNVRPIALTSCLCKLFESLIKNRLQWWSEHNNLIPTNQSGFRKGRSCHDNLVNLTLQVDEGMTDKKDVLAAFLDVRGAFDNVNIDILITKLATIGCSKNIIKFIKFLTHERQIYTNNATDKHRIICKGVPQGGVLSPLLYALYVSNIADNVPKSVTVSNFADDIAVLSKITPITRCQNMLEKAVNIIKQNLSHLGLELSSSKTVMIHFNNKNILPGNTDIKIGSHIIKSSYTARFLGIIFDYRMTFIPQTNEIHKKCMRALNIVKYLCGTWWGSDPETLITLYKSFVRSIIDYGCFIYLPTRKNEIAKLEKIRYAAIRAALGYRISTPTNILLAESKLPLIQERTKFLCKCYLSKILSSKNSQVHKTIQNFYKKSKKKKATKELEL